jgi:GT2 family glycosyltransferase/tetratricopeptide (TPR) repeat protein
MSNQSNIIAFPVNNYSHSSALSQQAPEILPPQLVSLKKVDSESGQQEKKRDKHSYGSVGANFNAAKPYYSLGKALAKKGECEKAIYSYRKALELDCSSAEIYQSLGDTLVKTGDLDEAVRVYQKAIELQPNLWEVHHNLGDIWQGQRRLDEAVIAYRRATELNPDFCWSHNNLGDVLIKQEKWEEAAVAYGRAIELNPDFHWSHYNLGEALVELERWEEAIGAYRRAIELKADLPLVNEKLGEALQKQSQFYAREAIKRYRQAIDENPNNVELYHKALEVDLRDAELYVGLGNALALHGQIDEAIAFYRIGLQVNPDEYRINWQLKNVLAQKDRAFTHSVEVLKYLSLKRPEPIVLKTCVNPVISIIIPVYNQILYTFNCLRSLAHTMDGSLPFEVIVIDDCSKDDTQQVFEMVSGIVTALNPENLGFIGSCNRGASIAKGQYLVFLNNDTVVLPNCFSELLETFKIVPEAGLVGAKLIYPDGQLQEAGGIIWHDGSAWNYGRCDDPNKLEYCYLREVDYCSGACIMLPKQLFNKLGGFDSYYKPAYCEDTDLAFQVKQAGYKVLYQPLAQVVHFEGVSSGRDTKKGVKKYQVINQKKFRERWQTILRKHRPNGLNPYFEKERNVRQRILVVDACPLTPDQDSGSITAVNHLKIFQSLSYKVTFAPDNLLYDPKYTADLQRFGVECLYAPYVTSLKEHLKTHGHLYNLVYLTRAEVAFKYIDDVKNFCPQAKVIYDTVDLHYVREQRQAQIQNSTELAAQAEKTKAKELSVAAKADFTLVVTEKERDVLLQENSQLKVITYPSSRDIYGSARGFAERKDLLFIGGFRHTPNVDAMLYFSSEIFPFIKRKLKGIKLYIIGGEPPETIRNLASDDIIVTGHLPDISQHFNHCKLSVAPLRYGAGIKGKILSSMSYGVPVVATSIASEGMQLRNQFEVAIADTPHDFAEMVVMLYNNQSLWNELSTNSTNFVKSRYSLDAAKQSFKEMLTS